MTQVPLDRPIWAALSTRQATFSVGGAHARCYSADVSPLAAASEDSAQSLAALAELVHTAGRLILLQAGTSPTPPGTVVEQTAAGVQMISETPLQDIHDERIVSLGDADAAEMVALAMLTKPGPFLARTHQLGSFLGIRSGDRLVAMAGERMRLDGFTEVSGVCTHPDFRGHGYARILSQAVAARIYMRGETPFLHAYAANEGAIRLYESLGFRLRKEMVVTVLRPD